MTVLGAFTRRLFCLNAAPAPSRPVRATRKGLSRKAVRPFLSEQHQQIVADRENHQHNHQQ
ncbi:MAG: hypothetical protein K2O01_07555, partial [Bacteroidales bacterium]|nr:hypothetical protein [Bacteroidales bacterium]